MQMAIDSKASEQAPEAVLVAQARAGDSEAFCALARRYEERLLQQACGLSRNRAAAEDLVCETLTEAWRSLARYDGRCRFGTWLFAILLHRFKKFLRAARSRPLSLASFSSAEAEEQSRAQEKIAGSSLSPADQALWNETSDSLRRALELLPAKHRAVLLLRFFEGASLQEIATVLGCSLGTVKSRLHYALEKLRSHPEVMNLLSDSGDTTA